MEIECNICNKKFSSEESLKQHNNAVHLNEKAGKSNSKKYVVLAVLTIAIVLIAYSFYARNQRPGIYDDFAKCLGEKAVIYGNDFCSYTNQQVNMFGKSKKYLNYVKCIENEALCDNKNVKITPTWEINGNMYEGVKSFETLSEASGCGI